MNTRRILSGLSRRHALQLAGGAAAVTSLGLAGCSGADESPNPFDNGGTDVKESPTLKELVDSGALPPLEDRLPQTPMVVQPVKESGRYGGTLRHAQTSDSATPIASFACSGLLEWDLAAQTQVASLAESFTVDDESRVFTFVLREGLKWSDGEPCGREDLEFSLTHFWGNSTLVPSAPYYLSDANQELPTHKWTDDRTLVLTFGTPTPLFPKYMAHPAVGYQLIKPKHYLEQFHADVAGKDKADAAAKKAGFDSWDLYFNDRGNPWTNPEVPVLGAYRVTKPSAAGGTATMERNPFYWKTDPDGRQLPYIDTVSVQVLGQEALDLRAANGELDFQGYNLAFGSSQVLLENAEAKGYSVRRWKNSQGTASLCPNLSHKDPELRKIFADVRFRGAVSHAINRDEINQALMAGVGAIRHPLATEGTEYAVPNGGSTFLEHDVAKANELLDEMGMAKQGKWRTRPNGKPFEPVLVFVERDDAVPLADAYQMVIANLAEVGLKVVLKPVDSTLYGELRGGNDFDIDGVGAPSDDMDMEPVWWIPTAGNSHTAPGYGLYYASGGETGMKPSAEIQQLMDNWDALRTAKTPEDRVAAGKEIVGQHDEKVYMIGLLRPPFQPVVVSNKLHNVREDEPPLSFYYGREGITKPEQLWLEQ